MFNKGFPHSASLASATTNYVTSQDKTTYRTVCTLPGKGLQFNSKYLRIEAININKQI